MEPSQNTGLITSNWINPQGNHFGAITSLQPEILRLNRDWTDYLGVYEPQSFAWGDSLSCVTFSALNCIEILAKFRTGQNYNFSDRFLAKEDGTTTLGNYLEKVADTIGQVGLVPEELWPATASSWSDYYRAIPPEIETQGLKFFDTFDYDWEWVGASRETLLLALQTSPVQATVRIGCPVNAQGYFIDGGSVNYAHVITIYAANDNYYSVFDHYNNAYKKYDKSYTFGSAIRFFLKIKTTTMANPLNLLDNTLVQLVEAPGGFGLFLGGKIIVDDLGKVQASWISRNSVNGKFNGGSVAQAKLVDWNQYEKIDLKGNPL